MYYPPVRVRLLKRLATGLLFAAAMTVFPLLVGCPTAPADGPPPDDNNGNGTPPDGTDDLTVEVVNFTANSAISELDPPVSVLFTATAEPDTLAGFYQPVISNGPGAVAIGDRVVPPLAADLTPLSPNELEQFKFDPQAAGVGYYRLGLLYTVGSEEFLVESKGIVQVRGAPAPIFIQPPPTQGIRTAVQGEDVIVSFDAGDPEGDVRWRLFYLNLSRGESMDDDVHPGSLGTELAVGSGNVYIGTFPTGSLLPGDYELGLSATDSGFSVAATSAKRVVTTESGPVVRVLVPQ